MKTPDCVRLRRITTDEKDQSTVAERRQNCGMDLNVGECLVVEPVGAVRGVVHVVPNNYGVPPLRIRLTLPHHCFDINRHYKSGLVKLVSTQNDEYKHGVKVISNDLYSYIEMFL